MTDFFRAIFENQIVAFIIVVGVVIFVHELGHFLMARIFGIDVEEFSLGFGPRAFGFRHGLTEYKVCWLPLGGYVRMYGSEIGGNIPIERRSRALSTAPLYKRVLVSAAGPFMNLLLTFVVMATLSFVGIEKLPTQVTVVPGSVAEKSGIPDGALLLSVNGVSVRTWEELTERISSNADTPLQVKYSWYGEDGEVTLTPALSNDETVYGEKVRNGRIGVTPYFGSSTVVVREGGLFALMGIASGDKVVRVGDFQIAHFHEIAQQLKKLQSQDSTLSSIHFIVEVERKGEKLQFPWTSEYARRLASDAVHSLGIVSSDFLFADSKDSKDRENTSFSQWKNCGLEPGVALVGIEGYGTVRSRVQILDWLEKSERSLSEAHVRGNQVSLFEARIHVLNKSGVLSTLTCRVTPRIGRDHLNRQKLFLDFPLRFATQSHPASPLLVRSSSVWGAFDDGFRLTWDMGKHIVDSVYKLVTGRIPFSNLGGPVEIARVAGSAAKVGWQAFVGMIAFISINVGILNLLPIPVLDGGTLLLLGVEAAYGKPLPTKVQDYVMRVGVFFILILVVLVLYNDVLRRLAH
jgi:regulator of sigma E protease